MRFISTLVVLLSIFFSPVFGAEMVSPSKASPTASKAKSKPAEEISSEQVKAQELVGDLTSTQKSKLLEFLNVASVEELSEVKGISTGRGGAIEKARPFQGVDEVILVPGIGKGTFSEIIKYGKTLTRSRSSSSTSSQEKS